MIVLIANGCSATVLYRLYQQLGDCAGAVGTRQRHAPLGTAVNGRGPLGPSRIERCGAVADTHVGVRLFEGPAAI
jgi:hypothetical protein